MISNLGAKRLAFYLKYLYRSIHVVKESLLSDGIIIYYTVDVILGIVI